MLSAEAVLTAIAHNPAVMSYLDGGSCTVVHVSVSQPDGPDQRVDACPCTRRTPPPDPRTDDPVERLRHLGEGQYLSSETHTVGDLVRDALNATRG